MTATVDTPTEPATPSRQPSRRWIGFGIANLVIVLVLAVASWYLLADPTTSPWSFYPLPFNAALFWAILFVVFIGFNCEFAGFDRLPQPAKGLAIMVATAAFAVVVTWLLANGLGSLYPDFAADREGGLGYFAGALFVLFGFGTWVMVVLNWQHRPWTSLGMKQPLVGLCEIAFVAVPTLTLYFVFGLPSVSLSATDPLMTVDTVLGWFYCVVVVVILTGQTLDNWPWRLFGGGGKTALAATIGNFAVGTGLYFVALPVVKALVGSDAVAELGGVIHQFPAQLGVCWAFWMIFWANAFGNKPTGFADGVNLAIRALLTFVLAVVTFLFYYRFAAEHILHEPAVVDGLHGNALGFVDWAVLWTLFYVVGFQSLGLGRFKPAEG
ncbi:hypothetical protein RQCS_06490 [Rhodococcus qingshengii]|uniref:hypothetical protein n=1 Tax=Rhodococcus qingshengii TaxID=334542 RepID=UPI0007E579F8|nr:hypothetical protein [Rhodococcus qingshengii]BCF81104.1 hypothetical protein RQCS_06490 [Rhodococcus qingshengii]